MTVTEKREWATALRLLNKTDMSVPWQRAIAIEQVEMLATVLEREAADEDTAAQQAFADAQPSLPGLD